MLYDKGQVFEVINKVSYLSKGDWVLLEVREPTKKKPTMETYYTVDLYEKKRVFRPIGVITHSVLANSIENGDIVLKGIKNIKYERQKGK